MNQDFSVEFEEEVLLEKRDGRGLVTLNRPKALNALSLEMIRQIASALNIWQSDADVKSVLFIGAGDRAFCAGGDLKIFHRAGMEVRRGNALPAVAAVFFAEEYSLNRQIFHYPKPTIAFMDGITMGGGYGIAGNCKHRIATERTLFAMPETGIGFFPDVGSMYYLTRAPINTGRFFALMAAQMKAGDMLVAKLADYFISSSKQSELIENLQKSDPQKVLSEMAEAKPDADVFKKYGDQINMLFSHKTVPEIINALEKDGSPWAKETLEILRKRSPASVMVSAAYYAQAKNKAFDEIITMDFILAQRFLERMDLYEGVRAVLIERDNAPKWEPATLEAVKPEYVQRYFQPTGYDLADVRIFAQ